MDLARALDAIGKFLEEVAARQIVDQLQQLAQALQQAVSAPNPANDENFNRHLKNYLTALDACSSNEWPPTLRRTLEQLGLAEYTGKGLRATLDGILTANSVTRGLAVQRVNELLERVRGAFNNANQIMAGFRALKVQPKVAPVDQRETTMLIPTQESRDTLQVLDEDLEGFNRLLKTLSEISGEGAASPRVTGLATGSWLISLDQSLQSAKHLAAMVAAIVAIIRGVGSLRKKTKALEEEPDTDPEVIEKLEGQAKARMDDGLDKIAVEITQKAQVDDGRRNQLGSEVRINVHFLARKLDRGVRIEISPPDQLPASVQQNKSADEVAQLQASLAQLKEQALAIAKMPDLKVPVLMFPDPDKPAQQPETKKPG